MLATLADVTCAAALWVPMTLERTSVATDLHVRYYRQPQSGPITARADLVYGGRRMLGVDCSVVDGDERELVRATATYMVVPTHLACCQGEGSCAYSSRVGESPVSRRRRR